MVLLYYPLEGVRYPQIIISLSHVSQISRAYGCDLLSSLWPNQEPILNKPKNNSKESLAMVVIDSNGNSP